MHATLSLLLFILSIIYIVDAWRVGKMSFVRSVKMHSVIDLHVTADPFHEDVSNLVDIVIRHASHNKDFSRLDHKLLIDSAHLLAKSNIYEEVMQKRLLAAASNSPELRVIQSADAFLKGFVQSERTQRAKLKVNYLLAGAQTGRLEQAVSLLKET